MSDKVEIIFYPDGRRVLVKKGTSILQAAIDEGIDIVSLCGGKGVCGKCKVIIEKGEVGYDLDEKELKHLSKEEIAQNYRLACRIKVQNDLVVRIPIESRTGKQRLQVEGIITPIEIDSIIRKYHLTIEPPTLKDTASDMDRINQYLLKNYKIERLGLNFDLLKEFGTKIRNYDWNFTITVWDNQQIISVENNDTKDQVYGFALDIGTTKLAAYLLNLNNGEVVAVESLMNPQIPFGEDVIARIGYKDHLKLQDVLLEGLNVMFEKLCQKANVNKDYVYDLSVVGNPTMIHLFLGIDPKQIGAAPYVPVITNAVNTCNEKFGLHMNKLSKIYTLPIISGYVGADTVGVVLATEIYKRDELCLALDIGTNTEVILGNKEKILSCSCASGPAFEGAHIEFGMRAASGAIEKIKIDPKTLDPKITTIDNIKPRGICGSAIVDIPAELLKSKIINVKGKFDKNLNHPRLRQGEKYYEYILVWGKDTALNKDIVITQKDIHEVILAKAAIHTGIEILMQEYGISEEEIDYLFIAGAFGTHIDIENARFIGMIPELPLSKIKAVGNAAGTGARMCLISKKMRNTAEEVAKSIKYIELGAHPRFQEVYLNSNYLPYAYLDRYPETSKYLKEIGNYPEKGLHIFKSKH